MTNPSRAQPRRSSPAEIERELYARVVLAVLKNPIGIETIDWEIADAVIALNRKLEDRANAAYPNRTTGRAVLRRHMQNDRRRPLPPP